VVTLQARDNLSIVPPDLRHRNRHTNSHSTNLQWNIRHVTSYSSTACLIYFNTNPASPVGPVASDSRRP